MKTIDARKFADPFQHAIKSLLLENLEPVCTATTEHYKKVLGSYFTDLVTNGAFGGYSRIYDVLGIQVSIKTPIDPAWLVSELCDGHIWQDLPESVRENLAGISAAVSLHKKATQLVTLLTHHPHPQRIPMITNDSESEPLSESQDREINDLLLEALSISKMHDKKYVFYFQEDK